MEIGIPRCRRLLTPVIVVGALVSSALLVTAPSGRAACPPGQLMDQSTRMCWSQVPAGGTYGGAGVGPCEPGLGLCMGDITDYVPIYTVPYIPAPDI
jgi:hypothetical protein